MLIFHKLKKQTFRFLSWLKWTERLIQKQGADCGSDLISQNWQSLMASGTTRGCVSNSCVYITCVLLQLFIEDSKSASLCRSVRLFRCIWASSSCLLGCTFEPLPCVSTLTCPLVGVAGGRLILRGLILMVLVWLGVGSWQLRLDLRGLASAGETGRSERGFLRGVRLMLASTSAVCFLFVDVDSSWKKSSL